MLSVIFSSILLGVALASGEFSVLVTPKSLAFKGDEKLNSEFLGDVYAASLGKSVSGSSQWSGLYISDPFNLPQNAIAVVIDGMDNLKLNSKIRSYRLSGYGGDESLSALAAKIDVAVIDMNEGVDKVEQLVGVFDAAEDFAIDKEASNLKPQLHSEDKLFLQQVAVLNKLADNIASYEHMPALVVLRLSLAPIQSAHGEKSQAVYEAQMLVTEALENLVSKVDAAKANVLVTAITNNNQHLRHKRQAEPKLTASNINVAAYYSEDYPVIFNIILWFMIVLAFSLIAISYAIASMDPGRDSIIYRMTSTRMKKDN